MHIMHLVTRLLRAGSEENTMETCRFQAALGHRVTLVHGQEFDPHWYENRMDGVELIGLQDMVHAVQPLQDIRAYRQLRRLFKEHQPDVIHTHQSKAGVLGRLASTAVPQAYIVHGIHIVPFDGVSGVKKLLYLGAERLAALNTDAFIGVSKAVTRAFLDAGIGRPDQMHCVRSGMDLEMFRRGQWPADWRALLGASQVETRPRVALMMAAFEPRKRHIPFLQAYALMKDAVPDLKLLLAGQGPSEQAVRGAVIDLGLQDHVVFCGHRPDPEALLAMADIAVLTSEREGLPRVLIQALAAGVPMVTNNLPGLDEVLKTGENGLILAAQDVDGAAQQMVRLLRDDVALRRLRRGAVETDLSAWDVKNLGPQTTALYQPSFSEFDRSGVAAE